MEYKNLNDYELVYYVRENDEVAYGALIDKYSHLVDMLAKKYLKNNKCIGIEYDDLYQEGMVGVFKALADYDEESTLFYTFASLCIKREMERLVKAFRRNKQMILNDAISINKSVSNQSDVYVEDVIPSKYVLEDEYFSDDNYFKLLDFKYELDFIDSLVFELKINNFSISEIAKLLELTYKNVDYRLHKIRKKILQGNFV